MNPAPQPPTRYTMPDVPTSVLRLAETLVMLAASADEQVAWLARHRWHTDELALDFDWANGWVPHNVDDQSPGLLPPALHDLLQRIDDALAAMSDDPAPETWTPEGLTTDPEWAELRHLAAQALTEIEALDLIAIPSPADL
ncbi:hypothetical protein HII36_36410 [Nonomuraea sp. NN258]|uniref:hypothetical protein n=1 Tax=Nonomuraea antri TaxID=2730852 RepID=UPI00156A4DC6|nr:hypothetical protein [Nonomuraea antri]NRQ37282.1 hypothetical protein [Nonomuraea antri]